MYRFPLFLLMFMWMILLIPVENGAAPASLQVVVDNRDARFVNSSWEAGDFSSDKYGPDYHYHSSGDGSSFALFAPKLPVDGLYEIYEWHPEGENRTSRAEIIINHREGSSQVYIDQKKDGGKWNLLGRFFMKKDESHNVRITDNFPSAGSYVVMADAFKFVCVAASEPIAKIQNNITLNSNNQIQRTVHPFGEYVQEVIDELESRKKKEGGGYLMKDKWGKYTGVTETLTYKGTDYMWNECRKGEKVKFSGSSRNYEPYGKSYCSGLTLEIWHRAMKKRDRDTGIPEEREDWNGLGRKGIFIFKKLWNVIHIRYEDTGKKVSSRPSPATALELSGVGYTVTWGDEDKFDRVRKYDFCDISRTDGSGHSIIFLNWIRRNGQIAGFRYYSTQKSTDGQGYNTEYFKGYGGKVLKHYFHAGRMYENPEEYKPNRIREAGYK